MHFKVPNHRSPHVHAYGLFPRKKKKNVPHAVWNLRVKSSFASPQLQLSAGGEDRSPGTSSKKWRGRSLHPPPCKGLGKICEWPPWEYVSRLSRTHCTVAKSLRRRADGVSLPCDSLVKAQGCGRNSPRVVACREIWETSLGKTWDNKIQGKGR